MVGTAQVRLCPPYDCEYLRLNAEGKIIPGSANYLAH
jgi:hypothetical protein